ncbi:MAG TPA: transcription antitermination factor NusB [Devosiaceae bacterium]|nr:transcription antitermination factor NusB [Devosiaceae bacterium]
MPHRPEPHPAASRRAANQRGSARLAAVQALYQMDVGGASLEQTLAQFVDFHLGKEVEGEQYLPADADFFATLVKGVVARQLKIDPVIDAALPAGWPLARIDSTLRAILRAGVFELRFRPDVPGKVAISEYVDVARAFYSPEEAGMVNAVLDRIARENRAGEFEAG